MRVGVTALLLLMATSLAPAQLPQLKEQPLPSALSELVFMADTTVGIVWHPSGCLLMADPDESQIVCTDLLSGATKRIGRRGAGPGEFGSIMGIAVVPGGSLVVQDLRNNRLAFIISDWTAGGSVPLETRMLPGLYRATRDSVFGLTDQPRLELLAVSLRTGGTTTRFSPGKADSALFALPHYRIWGFFMQPSGASGWLVASLGHHAVLRIDGNGRIVARAQRDLPAELPSAEEREARKAQVARLNPGLTAEQVRGLQARVDEYSKAPKVTTVKNGFLEDAIGRLWVVTSRIRADSTELDVYDPTGKFLGTRRVPGRVQAFTRVGTELLVLGEYLVGPLTGSQGVRRYRME
jgi:hypothetical protein